MGEVLRDSGVSAEGASRILERRARRGAKLAGVLQHRGLEHLVPSSLLTRSHVRFYLAEKQTTNKQTTNICNLSIIYKLACNFTEADP